MTFPSSVEHLPLPRSKRHGRRLNKQYDSDPQHESQQQLEHRDVEVKTEVGVGGTILDFGRSGGVGLERGKKGWEWVWASEDREDFKYVVGEQATCLFPTTRVVEKQVNEIPTRNMVDSSTKYIESLCSPYERYGLREALISILDDESTNRAGPSNASKSPALPIPERDPYNGPKLAIINNPRARIAKKLLAFPVGEVGHHLNISPFLPANSTKVDRRSKFRFMPTHKVVERFLTPILQIVSSPIVSSSRIDREATSLVVRLQSTTHLLNLIPDHTYVPPTSQPPILSQRVASLTYEDTEGRRHVDVAIDCKVWSRVLVADECGGVWLWWEEKDNRNGRIEKAWNLRKIRSKVTNDKHQFFRIAFGTQPDTAIVISPKEAVVIDLDDPSHPSTTLLALRGRNRYFTSLEKTALERRSQYTVMSTNQEVMWVDESKPGTPVLSWKHDFGSSIGLEVGVIPGLTNKDSCTILYSSNQPFILVFTTTKSSQLRSLSHPYPLSIPVKDVNTVIPFIPASFRHSRSLICTSPDGSIQSVPISPLHSTSKYSRRDKEDAITELKATWDENIQKLLDRPEDEEKGRVRRGREMDFRWAWLEINQPARGGIFESYFHPEEFEQYLREMDAPFEHLMTAGDLARDSIYPEPTELRSHLLNPLPLYAQASKATLESLGEVELSKHLPVISILDNQNLPIFEHCQPPLHPTSSTSAESIESTISPSSILTNLRESFPTSKKEDIAQLSLDLSLSRTILSSELISLPQQNEENLISTQVTEPDELFARAAGQLSLTDSTSEPPKIKFHFLIPKRSEVFDHDGGPVGSVSKKNGNGNGKEDREEDELQNITARGLLQDWKLGEDPSKFQWSSWRKDDNDKLDDNVNAQYPIKQSYSQPQPQTHTQSLSQLERMIKPLPSSSSSSYLSPLKQSQPAFSSQPNQYHGTPPILTTNINDTYPHPYSQPHSHSQPKLTPTKSLPSLRSLPPNMGHQSKSSPPPMDKHPHNFDFNFGSSQVGASQEEGNDDGSGSLQQFASTQVERGPFGGRDGGREKKKKKEKKRVGGF